jgi:hypothetical protein
MRIAATRLLIWGLGQFENILITGKYFILMTMVLIFFIVHNVGAKSWENGQAIAPTAVRRLIGGRDEGGIYFPNSIDSSEHRRGGNVRSEPRLSKSNLLDSGGSAQRLRDVLIYPQQHRAADE